MEARSIVFFALLSKISVMHTAEVFYHTHEYIQLKEGVSIDALEEDQAQLNASSITECFLHNKQQSYYVQALRNGSHWICSFFDYVQNVSTKFIPKEGSEIFRLDFSSTINECLGWLRLGNKKDGVYWINIPNGKRTRVFCDMTTDGGGWTVFQKRFDGSVDFYQNWESYRNGFGSLEGEHWLGLENIHLLTSISPNTELRLYGKRFNGDENFANFENFVIGDEASKYRLTTGTATTGAHHERFKTESDGRMFTTKDNDNDRNPNENCAIKYPGAWWFNSCFALNFNGRYFTEYETFQYAKGIHWGGWVGLLETLKESAMMMRSI